MRARGLVILGLGLAACGGPLARPVARGESIAREGVLVLDGLDASAIAARLEAARCASSEALACTTDAPDDAGQDEVVRETFQPSLAGALTASLVSVHVTSYGGGPRGTQTLDQWLVVSDGPRAMAALVRHDVASLVTELDAIEPARFAWTDLGGRAVLVLEVQGGGGDHDLCGSTSRGEHRLVLCEAAPFACATLELAAEVTEDRYPDCDEGTGDRIETTREGFRASATFSEGDVVIVVEEGEAPVPALVGRHAVSDLVHRAEVTWRDAPR